jgi:hypothetical protein
MTAWGYILQCSIFWQTVDLGLKIKHDQPGAGGSHL